MEITVRCLNDNFMQKRVGRGTVPVVDSRTEITQGSGTDSLRIPMTVTFRRW